MCVLCPFNGRYLCIYFLILTFPTLYMSRLFLLHLSHFSISVISLNVHIFSAFYEFIWSNRDHPSQLTPIQLSFTYYHHSFPILKAHIQPGIVMAQVSSKSNENVPVQISCREYNLFLFETSRLFSIFSWSNFSRMANIQ